MTRTTEQTRRRQRSPAARGFTVVELMLALVLSSLVIAAGVGLYQILHVSDRISQQRFEHAADLAVTQVVLRKIMNTLVSAPARPADQSAAARQDDEPEEDAPLEENGQDEAEEQEQAQATIFAPEAAPDAPMMFLLFWEDMEIERRTVAVPVLEVVVSEPPVALTSAIDRFDEEDLDRVSDAQAEDALRRSNRLAESVRGVIEVLPAPDGWMLQWRPIDPPARPFPLVWRIAEHPEGGPDLAWEVLSRDEKNTQDPWKPVWAAQTHAEFPQAVRLVFVTTDNQYTDWLFETHDSVQE